MQQNHGAETRMTPNLILFKKIKSIICESGKMRENFKITKEELNEKKCDGGTTKNTRKDWQQLVIENVQNNTFNQQYEENSLTTKQITTT